MKKQGKKWMLVALALLALVTVTLPLVGCKNDTVAEQTGDGTGSGSGNQGTGDQGTGDPEQPVTYTVSFKTNGGGFIDSQTIVSGQTATKPADPTLENNVFGGWYSDEDLTQEYSFDTDVTGSFTLYAKWVKRIEVNAYDVSFGIAELTGDGSYILVATGEWSSDDLSKLANELKDESKNVNLDLSEATGLTRIGLLAFDGCDSLTSISIPSSVEFIEDWAFSGCSGLTSIDLSKVTGLTTIGNNAFHECSSLTSISIPSSVTSIEDAAFSGCSGLTSIDLSKATGLTTIGDYAFLNCSGLTSIDLSKATGLTTIGDYAFDGCSELTTVTMKATTPPELGYGVFEDVSKILVPSGFVDTYKEKWSDYEGKIEPIPE